jgi:hypothetical protein
MRFDRLAKSFPAECSTHVRMRRFLARIHGQKTQCPPLAARPRLVPWHKGSAPVRCLEFVFETTRLVSQHIKVLNHHLDTSE